MNKGKPAKKNGDKKHRFSEKAQNEWTNCVADKSIINIHKYVGKCVSS